MTSSPTTPFLSEIADLNQVIPAGKLEYLRERLRNNLYHFVVLKFVEEEKKRGLTKAKLARRIGCDPGRLNKLLGAPGNWTIGTISDLLAGISAEELIPQSASLQNRLQGNYVGQIAHQSEISSKVKIQSPTTKVLTGSQTDVLIELN